MASFENELRLLLAILLNAAVLASAFRFVTRRAGGDFVQRAIDALLLYFAVQYIVIGALGLVGMLSAASIIVGGLLSAAALWAGAHTHRPGVTPKETRRDLAIVWGAFLFVVGYVAAFVWSQRLVPPLANDALTYHLPAAVHWLQQGRLALFETWFYNPANTYSPLAGSIFIAWLIAPLGNDVMARFVQVGPLLLIFFAVLDVGRRLGAPLATAALIAVAAVLSRPFISQVNLAKDDLFVAAFFLCTLIGLVRGRGDELDRWGGWRVGLAAGLMLATKYTALFSLPLLLLAIDGPLRGGAARWTARRWVIAAGLVLLLAGPWSARNLILTGNPLYPTDVNLAGVTVFEGLLTVVRSDRLALDNAWAVITQGYYGLTTLTAVIALAGWLATIALAPRRLLSDPLRRTCVVGPVIGVALFVFASPYAEVRFIYPSLLMLMACVAGAVAPLGWIGTLAAGAVAVVVTFTGFVLDWLPEMATYAVVGAFAGACGAMVVLYGPRIPSLYRAGAVTAVLLMAGMYAYVNWKDLVNEYADDADDAWTLGDYYVEVAPAWQVVRNEVEPNAVVAYTNAYLIYPLYGFDLDRRIVYAPTQPGVAALHDLPHFPQPTTGENILAAVAEVTWQDADRGTWLANLERSGADVLFIGKRNIADPARAVTPPELTFVRSMPQRFRRLLENDAAAVYRVIWPEMRAVSR